MNQNLENEIITNLAIGLGPSNLSLAALANNQDDLDIHFIEKKPEFTWLEGGLLKNTTVQSSIFRDLVTLVDPTSPFSFLSYLHNEKKIYQFMSANFTNIPRYELNNYYRWAAKRLTNVSYNEWVNEIHQQNGIFKVHTSKRIIKAKNIILGTGKIPFYPEHSILDISDNSFHGLMYASKDKSTFDDKKVVIVGNNQNAAEIFIDLVDKQEIIPSGVTWLSEDLLLNAEVKSPFNAELYTPAYNELSHRMSGEHLKDTVKSDASSINGIDKVTIDKIYHSLYETQYSGESSMKAKILANTVVNSQSESGNKLNLNIINKLTEKSATIEADLVIYCTGLEQKLPEFLNPIKSLFKKNESGVVLDSNQCVQLNVDIDNKIFMLNSAVSSTQVINQHLALGAYYGAKVINSLLGYDAYDLSSDASLVDWTSD